MILKHLRHHWLNQILISKDTHPIKEWNGQKQEKDGIFMLLKTMTCISFFQSSYFISTGCTFYTILWSWCFLASRGLDIWPLMWMIHSKMRLLRLIIRETMIPTVMFKIEIITLLFKPLGIIFLNRLLLLHEEAYQTIYQGGSTLWWPSSGHQSHHHPILTIETKQYVSWFTNPFNLSRLFSNAFDFFMILPASRTLHCSLAMSDLLQGQGGRG